jgi:hypothetical protein
VGLLPSADTIRSSGIHSARKTGANALLHHRLHEPSGLRPPPETYFLINGDMAKVVMQCNGDWKPQPEHLEILKRLAVEHYKSGEVSVRPMEAAETVSEKPGKPERAWAAQSCRPRQRYGLT